MLPLPDLDDRMFAQIVEESRKMIPKLAPQWTDENYHDPGITFIELFAWLAEMQQYYLNRITPRNRRKFLKLLGAPPGEAVSARTEVTFRDVTAPVLLPPATKLRASDLIFETEESILLIPSEIEKTIVYDSADSIDCTSANGYAGVTYYAFGQEALQGNRLYLGFSQELPPGRELRVTINLFEDYPVDKGGTGGCQGAVIPSARVSWTYYGLDPGAGEQTPAWQPLEIVRDETNHLSGSGGLVFIIKTPMRRAMIHPANDRRRYWICGAVEEEGYELPPRVDSIVLNTVPAGQLDTFSRVFTFSGSGQPGQTLAVEHYLSFYGVNQVQVRNGDGNWRYWQRVDDIASAGKDEPCYQLAKDRESRKTLFIFGSGDAGLAPPPGRDNIRLVSSVASAAWDGCPGQSNGLPNQVFRLKHYPVVRPDFMLQVGVKADEPGDYVWQDWEQVDDFDLSGPGHRHYVLHPETGEIFFGNNERGAIPEAAGAGNIRVISCRTGGGEAGNVKEGEINGFWAEAADLGGITVCNQARARGGRDHETIEDAGRRLRRELKEQARAVTGRDFEDIAKATPGLRVARVKAIPLYAPGLKEYPEKKAPAQVTVVVMPYSESEKPVPSKGFLDTVKRHLDKYRLISTDILVIPPEYIKVTVHAVVVTAPTVRVEAARIIEVLGEFLDPLDARDGGRGWPFGRTVYKGDIYGIINRVEGVEYIKDLWLNAEGFGVGKEPSGDIRIPPHGLVYSGEHEIETISRRDL